MTKYGDQYWEINPSNVDTHPNQWAAICVAAPGEQLGVRCLAQGHLGCGMEGGVSTVHSHPPSPPIPTGVVPNSAPCQIMHPLSIGRFRRRCGGGVRIRGGVGIRQSDSEGMHNLAGVQISAQHRP